MSDERDIGSRDIDGLLAATFLEVEGRELTGRDLVAAGVVSGAWPRFEDQLVEGLGLVAAQLPADAEINDEVRALRLQRGLLSAEDMRAWLAPRGLKFSLVKAAATRALARRRGGIPQPVTAAEVRATLSAEAICTGTMQELGWWLADRVLAAAATAQTAPPIALEDVRIQRLVFAEACSVAGAVSRDSGLERGRRLAWIVGLDDAHRTWEESVTGDRDVGRVVREHELDWCRLEVDELRLTSPGAAAEAVAQLADGEHTDRVAAAAGVAVTPHRLVLADAPSQLASRLAGAVVGDVAGPWGDGSEHVVVRVRERIPPRLSDQQLLMRARAELLAEGAARLRAGKVRWHERA
jgi:hypothetical protein